MKITVTNCHECPFCNNDDEWGWSCKVPLSEVEDWQTSGDSIPENCPLQNMPIEVSKSSIYSYGKTTDSQYQNLS
jgi:hypothetical protein